MNNWWNHITPEQAELLAAVWIPVGSPGYAGIAKAKWQALLDERFSAEGWRISHVVRGKIVSKTEAIVEYEEAYRQYLRSQPALVAFLTAVCGNVYDDNITNVFDNSYDQPHTAMNHYQDISVRRVIAELVDDPAWPQVTETTAEKVDLIDLGDGTTHHLPRARGFRGNHILQIRDPFSAGFVLNPAVIPVHDPTLITTIPNHIDWYHHEGCGHLSVEAFWQMSKVIEVRYDRFLALGDQRMEPLAGL